MRAINKTRKPARFSLLIIAHSVIFISLSAFNTYGAEPPKGLFNAKFGKGQVFDVQRVPVGNDEKIINETSPNVAGYNIRKFAPPYASLPDFSRFKFDPRDLDNKYFEFHIINRKNTQVGLYIYNRNGTPAAISDFPNKMPKNFPPDGQVAWGTVVYAGDDGLIFFGDCHGGTDLVYFVSLHTGYSYEDYSKLRRGKVNPTIEDLENLEVSGVPLKLGEKK